MYKKGDLNVTINEGECKWDMGYCENYNHEHPMDARNNEGDKLYNWTSLTHSCDRWIIAGQKKSKN